MAYATNPTDGVRIHYEVEGSGPPLVLLHWTTGSIDDLRENGYVDALRARHQLILLDARGHGRSDTPHDPESYALARFVGDIVAVLDAAGVASAHYFGFSLGGRVGFALGRLAPERARSLMLAGGNYLPEPEFAVALVGTLEERGMGGLVDGIEHQTGTRLPAGRRSRLLAMDSDALVASIRQGQRDPGPNATLPDISVPMLLFNVAEHPERWEQNRDAARKLPNATLVDARDGEPALTGASSKAFAGHIAAFVERMEHASRASVNAS